MDIKYGDFKKILSAVKNHEISPQKANRLIREIQKGRSIYDWNAEEGPGTEASPDSGCRAVVLHGPGNIRDVKIESIIPPEPGASEIQILVRAFSLNFGDLLCVKGLYPNMPDYPFTPGFEVSGTVVKTGKDVKKFKVGDDVIALMGPGLGGHSYIANTDERLAVEKPSNVSYEEACAFPVVFLTMYHVFEKAQVKKGEKILIQTAAGGTGLVAVQLAKLCGAEMYATAGSQEKLDYLAKMGVTNLIPYRQVDFAQKILEMTDNYGVDIVLNTLSGDAIQKGIDILAPGGRYIEIAMTGLKASGGFNLSNMVNNQAFYSVDLRRLLVSQPDLIAKYLDKMVDVLKNGTVKPTVCKTFTFDDIQAAYRSLENRENIGKIVVTLPDYQSLENLLLNNSDRQDAAKAHFCAFGKAECDIAVIGMSGRFPGAANLAEYWEKLSSGTSCIREVPKSRWDADKYYDPDPQKLDKTYCKWGGFIDDIDKFDAMFFNMSGKEAEMTDPQQRIFMEECWSALEDAGYSAESMSGRKCAVFAGVGNSDYMMMAGEGGAEPQSLWGTESSILPARISYFMNLKGPSVAVNTACSSSLVAIHLACQSIWSGENEMAIAGGAFISVTPAFHILTSNAGMLSEDGKCKTFDDGANGFVPGEGVGVVVLKSLEAAKRDGDHIYGVIKGSGINQDGKTNGITAPSTLSQTELELYVYDKFGINPETISYVETHGTGTRLGDPIEIEALTNAFRKYTDKKQYCAIGSVKTNIGHASAAAGVAGVIKVLLCLRHKKIVPSLNFSKENRHIDFKNSPFYVNTQLKDWETGTDCPRCAAVSSFGFSGTNAHLVIEEYEEATAGFNRKTRPCYLIPVSAKTKTALSGRLNDLLGWLEDNGSKYSIEDISNTLCTGRSHFPVRAAIIARDVAEMKTRLKETADKISAGEYEFPESRGRFRPDASPAKQADRLLDEISGPGLGDGEYSQKMLSLAELFLRGCTPDFSRLFKGEKHLKVPLPAYPFERERYWYRQDERCEVRIEGERVSRLHPLIEKNTSSLEEEKFTTALSGDEFYLRDHVIGSRKMLPGAVYLEMARIAGEIAGMDKVSRIRDTVWASPFIVGGETDGTGAKEINISLFPNAKAVDYEVWSQGENKARMVHAQGKLLFGDPGSSGTMMFSVDTIRNRCTKTIPGEECYSRFEKIGIRYGSTFRTLKELYLGEKEALSRIELADRHDGEADLLLNPLLLDGALQTLMGLALNNAGEVGAPYLPFSLGETEIFDVLPRSCYVYVKPSGELRDLSTGRFDIWILNREGLVLAQLRDLAVRALKSVPEANATETVIYHSLWESKELVDGTADKALSGGLLLFDTDESAYNYLKEKYGDAQIVLVKPGNAFTAADEYIYEVNPKVAGDYTKLIARIRQQGIAVENIIHMWSKDGFSPEGRKLKTQVELGCHSAINTARALMENKLENEVSILFVHTVTDGAVQPQNAAMEGLAKSINLESAQLACKIVEIPGEPAADLNTRLDMILGELNAGNKEDSVVRYKGKRRFIRVFREFEDLLDSAEGEGKIPLKNGGLYLITGGAGGLGLIFAEYIARHAKASVILTGRSELTPEKEKKLQKIKAAGSDVIYFNADISKGSDVSELMARIKSSFGQLNGIIHAAGELRDSLIINKTNEDIDSVLAPKVYGTVLLDEATSGEPLDFFVMMSSLAAVTGNVGQADYAYANGFMDHYAEYRETLRKAGKRQGRTLSINWPLWRDGSMTVTEDTRILLAKTLGLVPMRKETGFKVLEAGLAADEARLIALEGDMLKIKKALELGSEKRSGAEENGSIRTDSLEDPTLRQKMEEYLKEVLAMEVRLPVNRIDVNEPLERYGIDSAMIVNMTRTLEKDLGELSKTLLFEYQTLGELSEYLVRYHGRTFAEKMGVSTGEHKKSKQPANEMETVRSWDITSLKRPRFIAAPNDGDARESGLIKDIAIIGVSGRYPMAGNLEEYWENLAAGRDCISEIPAERWDYRKYFSPDKEKPGLVYSKWGGFIDNVDKFDPLFFNISPREAELMDPQERLFLETVWHAMEDSGYTRKQLTGSRVGVFAGVMYGHYQLFGASGPVRGSGMPASSHASVANRISYFFGFRGPSIAVDTMCSSSLTAIHLACRSINAGECDMAVAGGVNVTIHPYKYFLLSQGRFASTDGRCRSFGEGGDGYVPGEGVGAVILKPLDKAIADGDNIYAVIRGSAVNHGGKTNGYSVPNPNAQAEVIADALKKAGVDARRVSCVEAHGTGTSLGDPIEITGLVKAYRQYTQDKQFCSIGSVKSNIGHLESAAGIAAVTKILLQMKHKKLVPSIHSDVLNPNINFEDSPFYVQHELGEWKKPVIEENGVKKACSRIAAVSSFGAGGSNAHIILEEWEAPAPRDNTGENGEQVIVISARNKERLNEYVKGLTSFLKSRAYSASFRQGGKPENTEIKVAEKLVRIAADITGAEKEYVSAEDDLKELGFDLVALTRFAGRISREFGIDWELGMFSIYPSVRRIARYIAGENAWSENVPAEKPAGGMHSCDGIDCELTLKEVAYTLQTGREAMEERIAVVAGSIEELIEKLESYNNGERDIGGLYTGSLQGKQSKAALLIEGEAGEAFMNVAISRREFSKLAQMWTLGIEIDWNLLYKDGRPRKVSLPPYPFARERCWIPETGIISGSVERLHPLLERNTSTLNGIRFSTRLYSDDLYAGDYRASGKKLLAPIVAVEMARAAGEFATERPVAEIRDIAWGKAIEFNSDYIDIEVRLYPVSDVLEYEVCTVNANGHLAAHSQGVIVNSDTETGQDISGPIDIDSVKESCGEQLSHDDIYSILESAGTTCGNSFRVLKQLNLGVSEALAVLELPENPGSGPAGNFINPLLLEGACHAAVIFAGSRNSQKAARISPVRLERIRMTKPLVSQSYYAYITKQDSKAGQAQEEVFSLLLADVNGQVLIRMDNLFLRKFETAGGAAALKKDKTIRTAGGKPGIDLYRQVEEDIRRIAAEILKISPQRLDTDSNFGEFGFESIALKELADKISLMYKIDLLPTIFYSKPDIRELSEYIADEFKDNVESIYKGRENSVTTGAGMHGEEPEEEIHLPLLSVKYGNGARGGSTGTYNAEPVAVVGMYGIMPGSGDLEEFWQNLLQEKDLITEVPKERWDWRDYHVDYADGKLKTRSKWGGFIPDVDKFDPRFFNISPAEAEMMDPQHRIFLEIVWKTIEDAGYKVSEFSGRNIGIFAGVQFNDYQHLLGMQGESNPMMGLGNEHSIFVNRISYLLNFHGPSEPYNTACSSSGVAIHRAVRSIRTGECEMAIAGGISLILSPFSVISADQMGILSPDGRCKTLDKSANGYVKGEGAGALLLKPLQKAIKDNDHIYAVIKGTSVNHGGKAASITAPNSDAQAALIVKAHEEAGIDPETITYLELHGTGTELGDPVEIEGIKLAFMRSAKRLGKTIKRRHYCGIGSVKTNIGHLEPASGIAGVIKVILALQGKKLPGILHLKELNPYVKIDNTPFYIVNKTMDWQRLEDGNGGYIPRRAGVSSFGFGGVNSHILLEEYEYKELEVHREKNGYIFVLSAKNVDRLKCYARNMLNFIDEKLMHGCSASFLHSMVYTLQTGREEMNERLACVVSGMEDLRERLAWFCDGDEDTDGLYRGSVKSKSGGLNDDEDDIRRLIASEDYHEVAKLWVSGRKVDWRLFYPGTKPRRISLPTYPFARERYWAPAELKPIVPEKPTNPASDSGKQEKPLQPDASVREHAEASIDTDYILGELKTILAAQLKMDPNEIDGDVNISEYGVDSILSSVIMQVVQQRFGSSISLSAIVEHPTLRELSEYILEEMDDDVKIPGRSETAETIQRRPKAPQFAVKPKLLPEIFPFNTQGIYQTSFWVHGAPGFATFFKDLSDGLGKEYPLYAFQAKGVDGKSMPQLIYEMAQHYVDCIRMVQPEGPYCVGGYSYGGLVAYEMAQILNKQGAEVTHLVMYDTMPATPEMNELYNGMVNSEDDYFLKLLMANEFAEVKNNNAKLITKDDMMGVSPRMHIYHLAKLVKERGNKPLPIDEIYNYLKGTVEVVAYSEESYAIYKPLPYDASGVLYFKAAKGFVGENNFLNWGAVDFGKLYDYVQPWRELIRDLKVVEVPSDHFGGLEEPALSVIIEHTRQVIPLKGEAGRKPRGRNSSQKKDKRSGSKTKKKPAILPMSWVESEGENNS